MPRAYLRSEISLEQKIVTITCDVLRSPAWNKGESSAGETQTGARLGASPTGSVVISKPRQDIYT